MISFVVPVYNGEKYLRPCLDSILSQSMQDLELICVNDGSKDSSQRILEEYAAKDPRVRVVMQENQGVSAARNHGMDLAKGEYLWFFDCDDIMLPGVAEAMLKRIQETGADFVMANCKYYHQYVGKIETPAWWKMENKIWTGDDRLKLTHASALCGCKLWNLNFLRKNSLRFWPYHLAEDVAFFLCCVASSERIAGLALDVYYYRIYDGSSYRTYSLRALERIEIFDKVDAFYKEKGNMEDFRKELLFDRIFHYNLEFCYMMRHKSKQERKTIFDAYIASKNQQDFSGVQDRQDIMEQVRIFDNYVKHRRIRESNLLSLAYACGQRVKKELLRIKNAKNRVDL